MIERSGSRTTGSEQSGLLLLLEQITDLMMDGNEDACHRLIEDHPECASELEAVLPAMRIMQNVQAADMTGVGSAPPTPTDDPHLSLRGRLGDFQIIREIGRGGMGVVYEAEQLSLGRRVALKVLPLAATLDPNHLRRFQNEARASASLRHPHIVGIHSVGIENGVHYIAMELVEGQSLAHVIDSMRNLDASHDKLSVSPHPGEFPPTADTKPMAAISTQYLTDRPAYFRHAASLMASVADALHYAHSQGITHRDVKPANLLLDRASHVWLTDFGLARLESDVGVTLTGDILGTVRYMSPEQAIGKPSMVDFRTDIHAIGATLYEFLTLQPAFAGEVRGELLQRITHDVPVLLKRVDRQIPTALETIVAKAMEKDREDRYESAEALADDLRAFADGRPISARPPTWLQNRIRWGRRHSTAVATAFCVMLFALIVLAVSATLINRERSAALQLAVDAQRSARLANTNFELALKALEDTLTESVAGNLALDYRDSRQLELANRGIEVYEAAARANQMDPGAWPAYQLLIGVRRLFEADELAKQNNLVAAKDAYIEALQQSEQLYRLDKSDARYRVHLISCLNDYGNFLSQTDANEESLQFYDRAEKLGVELCSDEPDLARAYASLGLVRYCAGTHCLDRNDLDRAHVFLAAAEKDFNTAWGIETDNTNHPLFYAKCVFNLARCAELVGQKEKAKEWWDTSMRAWRTVAALRPRESECVSRYGASYGQLARMSLDEMNYTDCCSFAQEAIRLQLMSQQLEPVFEHSAFFLQEAYLDYMRALEMLRDWKKLAEVTSRRLEESADDPQAWCDAAVGFSSCAEVVFHTDELGEEEKHRLVDDFAKRALETLRDACLRFNDVAFQESAIEAYVIMRNGFASYGRADDSDSAHQQAAELLTKLRTTEFSEAVARLNDLVSRPPSERSDAADHGEDTLNRH